MLRAAWAVLAGLLTLFGTLYAAAVAQLLLVRGLPLGSAGGAPSGRYLAVLLGLATLAGAAGGRVAARLAPAKAAHVVATVAVISAAVVLVGFARPAGGQAGGWPSWWSPTLAATLFAGALLARAWPTRRPH